MRPIKELIMVTIPLHNTKYNFYLISYLTRKALKIKQFKVRQVKLKIWHVFCFYISKIDRIIRCNRVMTSGSLFN